MLWNTINKRLHKSPPRVSDFALDIGNSTSRTGPVERGMLKKILSLLSVTLLFMSVPITSYAVEFVGAVNVRYTKDELSDPLNLTFDVKLPAPLAKRYTMQYAVYTAGGTSTLSHRGWSHSVTSNTGTWPTDNIRITIKGPTLTQVMQSNWHGTYSGIDIRFGTDWAFYPNNSNNNKTRMIVRVFVADSKQYITAPTCTSSGVTRYHYIFGNNCYQWYEDIYAPATGHNYSAWQTNSTQHWKTCTNCNAVSSRGNHTLDAAGKCTTCGGQ